MRAVKSNLRWFVTALSAFAQIAALVFWTRWAFTQHLLRRHGLAWIVLIAAASIVTTVIHECGHAVIAWCFEMKLLSFKAGPFQWASREGNWAFKFNAAGLVSLGGSISAAPTRPDQPAWEYILMIASGPGANLLIGAAATWAVLHDRWSTYQQSWQFIAYLGAFCLIAAVLNLIPFVSEEGSYSDGARILQIVTGSPLAVLAPATIPAADAIAVPEPAPARLTITPQSVVPPRAAPTPSLAPVVAPQVAVIIADPGPAAVVAAKPTLKSAPEPVAAAPAASIPPSAPLARPTLTPGTIRPADPVVLAAAKAEHTSAAMPPVPAAIPVSGTGAKPAPDLDAQLAARLQSFLARPTPVAKAPEPEPAARIPAPPAPISPVAAVKQESIARLTPQIIAPAAENLSDPFARIASAPAPAAPIAAAPASTVPVAAVKQASTLEVAPKITAPIAEKPQEAFAGTGAAPAFAAPAQTATDSAPTVPVAARVSVLLPPPPEAGTSLATLEPGATGLIASATRIPTSALTTTAPKPPAIRLQAAAAPAATTAPGSTASSVPAAFARRARPAPLSGLPGIEEILAAAAIPVDDPADVAIAVEEPAPVAPVASATLPPTPLRASGQPAASQSSAPSLSEEALLGPTFSESWPPRPAATPQPAAARSESLAPTPAALASQPASRPRTAAGDAAIDETALPPREPETPRSDPFDFIRAAFIESLNANPG